MPRVSLPGIRWVLACWCVIHSINANCPLGWKSWRDSCYITLSRNLDWDQASRACGRPGSSIAVPNSLEENEFIHQIQNECSSGGVWLGCRRNRRGVVTCLDQKQPPSFELFIHNHTNSSDCVMMSKGNDGKWQDTHFCTLEKKVICEMSRQVHVYSLTMGEDGRVQRQCLSGHEIKNVTVSGVIECGKACWAEPECHSFSLRQKGPLKVCQLNDATILEAESDVVYDSECSHFELEN